MYRITIIVAVVVEAAVVVVVLVAVVVVTRRRSQRSYAHYILQLYTHWNVIGMWDLTSKENWLSDSLYIFMYLQPCKLKM